jgi:phytoene dehydrogenase-like protein
VAAILHCCNIDTVTIPERLRVGGGAAAKRPLVQFPQKSGVILHFFLGKFVHLGVAGGEGPLTPLTPTDVYFLYRPQETATWACAGKYP